MMIESTAPISTPRRTPDPSTPRKAAAETANSVRLKRQRRRIALTLTSPMTAISTIAASTGCGRLCSRPERNSDDDAGSASAAMSPESGVRAPPALVDQRLRHPAADREPAAEACGQVGAGQRPGTPGSVEAVADA